MKRTKRKYTRHPITNELIIKKITTIRSRNNRAWMAILALAFKAKPRQASKIMNLITENDRAVVKWLARLS